MYKLFTVLFLAVFIQINGQTTAPKFINYQGVARDAAGVPIIIPFDVHFVIKDLSSIVHDEIQTNIQPNQYGLFSTQIGMAPNTLTLSNWNSGPYTMDVFIKPGNTFMFVGTQNLVSVPFSLFAGTVPSSYTNNILTIGNNSYNLPTGSSTTPTINGTGLVTVTPNTGSLFSVNVPTPTLNYASAGNILTLTQGTAVSTATLSGAGTSTLAGDVIGPVSINTVTALRNIPIANLTPTNGQSLIYNGSVWTPSTVISATLPAAAWVKSASTVTLVTPTDNVGIGITNPINRLSVQSSLASAAILATNTGAPNNSSSNGITAKTDNANAAASGLYAENSGNGYGIYGANINATGTNPIGVYGKTNGTGTSGIGVLGENNGAGVSVQGINFSGSGSAVQGVNQGIGIAVHGVKSPSTTSGNAGKFEILSSSNNADAMFATTAGVGAAVHAASSPTLGTSALALLLDNGHIASTGASPTPTVTASLIGGTLGLLGTSTDIAGRINITFGTGPFTANTFVGIVFNKPYSVAPIVILTPVTAAAATATVHVTSTINGFTITHDSSPAGGSLQNFNYIVIETK